MDRTSHTLPPISDLLCLSERPSSAKHTSGVLPPPLSLPSSGPVSDPIVLSEYNQAADTRHHSDPSSKVKRKRATPFQVSVLNRVFNQTSFPSTELRLELSKQLGMSPRTVQIWFQNKRQSIRNRERQVHKAMSGRQAGRSPSSVVSPLPLTPSGQSYQHKAYSPPTTPSLFLPHPSSPTRFSPPPLRLPVPTTTSSCVSPELASFHQIIYRN